MLPLLAAAKPPAAATNAPAATAPAAAKPAAAPTAGKPSDPISDKVADAMVKMNKNDVDGALASLSDAIKLGPKEAGPYVMRASVYCQKKMWPQAEADFKAALALSPDNTVIKFNLVEMKFFQKQYDAARAGYLTLTKDPDVGDLASFKVFVCDLVGGHPDQAKKELDAFNQVGSNPSYYFANAAWAIYQKKTEEARNWLVSASNIFALRKNAMYAAPLREVGYLPLPQSADQK